MKSDVVFVFDTFSVGLPTVLACKIFNKKSIIRTGGDFLWEQYVEKTGKTVLLRNFYTQEKENFSLKEKVIFNLTKWVLLNSSGLIFSTEWQKRIFTDAYDLKRKHIFVVENFYGPKEADLNPQKKIFVGTTRKLEWKNLKLLERVFNRIKSQNGEVELFTNNMIFPELMEKIKNSYAVIQVSLGDISPNLILDSIRYNRPFICTKETGLLPRIESAGMFVDPLDENEIEQAVLRLLDKNEYEKARNKVRNFSFVHSWEEISNEFLYIYEKII